MSLSSLLENPGFALLAILAFIAGVLVLPIVSSLRRSRDKPGHGPVRMLEPRIVPDLYDDYRDERYDYGGHAGFAAEDSYERHDRGYRGYVAEDPYERHDRGYADAADEDRGARQDYRDHAGYFAQDRGERHPGPRNHEGRGDDVPPRAIFGSGRGVQRRSPVSLAGPAKGLWFVFGAAAGIGAMVLWSSPPSADSLTTLIALFESPNPSAVAEEPRAPAAIKAQERIAPIGETASATPAAAGADDVDAVIEAFVTSIRTQLPMAVGPGITMATVDAGANTIALGFTIAQSVAGEDAPKLQSELETRFRSSVCATDPDPSNIHGLNALGVAFLINYTDLLGKSVAALTVEPNYCAGPA